MIRLNINTEKQLSSDIAGVCSLIMNSDQRIETCETFDTGHQFLRCKYFKNLWEFIENPQKNVYKPYP